MIYLNPYDLCDQTVTVYHEEGGEITRTVHRRAFLDENKTENVGKTGSSEASGFLLVVVGDTVACKPQDKVFRGEGPEVPKDALKWWRTFIPSKIDGLVVVKSVDAKRDSTGIVHTEAGG